MKRLGLFGAKAGQYHNSCAVPLALMDLATQMTQSLAAFILAQGPEYRCASFTLLRVKKFRSGIASNICSL